MTTRPLLVDVCCCGGGCSVGYHRAGFDIVGVDVVPQHAYPFPMRVGDGLRALDEVIDTGTFDGRPVAAVHVSPPCKRFTALRHTDTGLHLFDPHPDMLTPTLERCAKLTIPWVIENVPGAPLPGAVTYCGSSFGLQVRRHRLFLSNVPLEPPPCDHASQPVVLGVYGNGGADAGRRGRGGGGGTKVARAEAARALGCDWTDHQPTLSQMIPPAYTEHVGAQLLAYLEAAA